MEHEHRACPRCGKPAGDYHFCPSCLAPIDSLTGGPARSERGSDRSAGETSTAAVQVKAEQRAVEGGEATGPGLDVAQLPPRDHMRVGDVAQAPLAPAPRDVARLEDVLTVARRPDERPADSPLGAEGAAGDEARDEPVEMSAAPVGPAERPASPREPAGVPRPALTPFEVLRLEGVSTPPPTGKADEIAPRTAAAAPPAGEPEVELTVPSADEVPAWSDARAATPVYVDAHALREAFWFEQASLTEVDSDQAPAASADSRVEPEPAEALAQHEDAASLVRLWLDQTSRNGWLAAICLLALVALVVLLTSREPRHLLRGKASS
jgi:hypothetical protein